MILQRIQLRLRYYWRKFLINSGICPDCHNDLNIMPSGRTHCPECGR